SPDVAVSQFCTLSLHDALPISLLGAFVGFVSLRLRGVYFALVTLAFHETLRVIFTSVPALGGGQGLFLPMKPGFWEMQFLSYNPDRKSTRLNSSHVKISYAVFC